MSVTNKKKTDEKGYNEFYKGSMLNCGTSKEDFERNYEKQLSPFCQGGVTKGYVRGLATQQLIQEAIATGKNFNKLIILDTECGLGGLSTYLALKGFTVVGIDISNRSLYRM